MSNLAVFENLITNVRFEPFCCCDPSSPSDPFPDHHHHHHLNDAKG